MSRTYLAGVMLGAIALLGVTMSCSADESAGAAVGQPAPHFALEDQDGKRVDLSDLKGKIVVLEWWNEACPFIQRHAQQGTMNQLAQRYADRGVVWLAINSTIGGTQENDRNSIRKWNLSYPILHDAGGVVGQAYGAKTTPHMFIIDASGKVVYSGAIDDDPNGKNSDRVNYVAKALDELLAGQPVAMNQTRPYGCGIKYAK